MGELSFDRFLRSIPMRSKVDCISGGMVGKPQALSAHELQNSAHSSRHFEHFLRTQSRSSRKNAAFWKVKRRLADWRIKC